MKWLLKIVATLAAIWNELNGSAVARRKWETKLHELEAEIEETRKQYEIAVLEGCYCDSARLHAQWLQLSNELAYHRRAGQRAGYLR